MMGKIFERILKNKGLPLVLIVFTIFTVSLTENLQIADGLSGLAGEIKFDLQRGETDIQTWEITNTSDEKIWVEFFTSADGGELILFEKILAIEPHQSMLHEFIVKIPKDHKDNITYKPTMHALKRAEPVPDGTPGATVNFNVQLLKTMIINIGDNPIYTPPVIEEKYEIPEEPYIPEKEEAQKEKAESLEDKMARIAAANEAREIPVEEVEQVSPTNTPVTPQVGNYEEEPMADPEPVTSFSNEKKVECGFIDWLLSLFGIVKC